jgi:hydroxymethylglutaryl-CoA lyase
MGKAEVKIIECPRDAMQGIKKPIPTSWKVQYINALLEVGFDTIDFGSFVSPKAIPQMADTSEVLEQLNLSKSSSGLLAIVANQRGGQEACRKSEIEYIGYPYSISPTFLKRNINKDTTEAFEIALDLKKMADEHQKALVVYISMAFGNPYSDEWGIDLLREHTGKLVENGINIISISDTVGIADPDKVHHVFDSLLKKFREIEFGLHLHTTSKAWYEKIDAAYLAGCRRFDSVLNGLGGCPMAGPDLVGNVRTTDLLQYFEDKGIQTGIDADKLLVAAELAKNMI